MPLFKLENLKLLNFNIFFWDFFFLIFGLFGFLSMIFFLFVLAVGFAYEWKKGALEWN